MKKPGQVLLLSAVFCWCSLSLHAQQAIAAGGGDGAGDGGSLSFTIGQVVYTTQSSAGFSEAQGVQQPFEISVVTNTFGPAGPNIEAQLFPNPTAGHLTLDVKDITLHPYSYRLYNLKGQLLEQQALRANQTEIVLTHLPAATYLLSIVRNNQISGSFTIIKN